MTGTAFFLILLSVLLHASWHFLSKTGKPSIAFFSVLSLSVFATLLPIGCFSSLSLRDLPSSVWIPAIIGGLFGALADAGTAYAYAKTDISLAYPVGRALPVLFTSAATAVFGFGAPLGITGWMAMPVIFAGCLLMAFSDSAFKKGNIRRTRGLGGILVLSLGVTGYTIADSFGIHAVREAAGPSGGGFADAAMYSAIREAVIWSILIPVSLILPGERRKYTLELFRGWHPYVAGIFAATAYLLVLLAMAHVTNVSYVQAFRQLSLPVGMAMGALFLKEKISRPRIAGIVLILGGLLISVLR